MKNHRVIEHDGAIHLCMKKFVPVIIQSDDECRKGIEITKCSGCNLIAISSLIVGKNEKYCYDCGLKFIKSRKKK